jgi:hypothetical protein
MTSDKGPVAQRIGINPAMIATIVIILRDSVYGVLPLHSGQSETCEGAALELRLSPTLH